MELPKILLAIASNIFPLTKLMMLFRKWKFLDVQSRINCSSNHRRIQVGGLKSNLLFGQNLPKTACKWRKSDQEREGSVSKILLRRSASCNYNSCFHVWRESTRVASVNKELILEQSDSFVWKLSTGILVQFCPRNLWELSNRFYRDKLLAILAKRLKATLEQVWAVSALKISVVYHMN